jgi:uncharacterized protein YjbI with pentapeptide repeats
MFMIKPCAAGCGRSAITGTNTCALHSANQAKEAERIAALITEQQTIKDINAAGLHFIGVDFSKRRFFGCNFYQSKFSMCLFSETFLRMSFFDFATLLD